MRLNIRIFHPEKFFRTVNRQSLNFVHHFATAVISSSRITFCIFIGEDASHRFHYMIRNKIFWCDKFYSVSLSLSFLFNEVENWIHVFINDNWWLFNDGFKFKENSGFNCYWLSAIGNRLGWEWTMSDLTIYVLGSLSSWGSRRMKSKNPLKQGYCIFLQSAFSFLQSAPTSNITTPNTQHPTTFSTFAKI